MHLCKYQINPCPAEPRYIPFLQTTDQDPQFCIQFTVLPKFSYTRKEPTQARKYFMIVNLPLFCI